MSCKIDALTPNAKHKSTYGVNATFTETDPDTGVVSEVAPTTVSWTLTTLTGAAVNTGTETPASTVLITIQGDDLDTADGLERIITINALYNSVLFGTNSPLTIQKRIVIDCYIPAV